MNRALSTALFATLLALPGLAQPAAEAEPEDLSTQVAKANTTLTELVGLMRRQVEGRIIGT